MKRIFPFVVPLALLALFCIPAPARAASLVQSAVTCNSGSGTSSFTCNFSATTSGSLCVAVAIQFGSTTGNSTITDSGSHS